MPSHHLLQVPPLLACAFSVLLAGRIAIAPAHGQLPPTQLQTADVLDVELMQGEGYSLDDTVEVHDSRFLFLLRTEYGDVRALGLPMLELRLREHHAVQQALELVDNPLILKGIVEIARDTPGGAKRLLRDPLGSLIRVPKQIKQTVDSVVDPLDRRAGNSVRRELAVTLGADPETRSKVLDRLLDHLAARKSIGRLAAQIGLGAAVPGLGLLAINKEIQHDVRNKSPRQIAADVRVRLEALSIDIPLTTEFALSRQMTSTEKLLFVDQLETMQDVEGLDQLVASAATADTEAHLLTQLLQARVLADRHRRTPLSRIDAAEIPLARLSAGQYVAVVAVDYVQPTDPVAQELLAIRKRLEGQPLELIVTGQFSPAMSRRLQDDRIRVTQLPVRGTLAR